MDQNENARCTHVGQATDSKPQRGSKIGLTRKPCLRGTQMTPIIGVIGSPSGICSIVGDDTNAGVADRRAPMAGDPRGRPPARSRWDRSSGTWRLRPRPAFVAIARLAWARQAVAGQRRRAAGQGGIHIARAPAWWLSSGQPGCGARRRVGPSARRAMPQGPVGQAIRRNGSRDLRQRHCGSLVYGGYTTITAPGWVRRGVRSPVPAQVRQARGRGMGTALGRCHPRRPCSNVGHAERCATLLPRVLR